MNIGVVGAGVVGLATGKGFIRLGHEVTFYDTNFDVVKALSDEGFKAQLFSNLYGHDVYFVCVPEKNVKEPLNVLPNSSWAVIRSTVDPTFFDKYPSAHLCSNPEFLREGVAEYEFLNPPGIIIGQCCQGHGNILEELYSPFRRPIIRTTPKVAAMTKLAVNSYLACQVSFWNQLKLLGDKIGVNMQEVGMMASFCDERVSEYGSRMHGRAYGLKCLPKDLEQLIALYREKDVIYPLLAAIKAINDNFKQREART